MKPRIGIPIILLLLLITIFDPAWGQNETLVIEERNAD